MVYYEIMNGINNIFNLRLNMVQMAQAKSISETARYYKTTRNTVRKWLNRYTQQGLNGLTNRKRTPKHIPHKTPKAIEEKIIELRKSHPAWGPERLKMHYEIPVSTKAIARIIRQAGLVKKRKRKWKRQRDLRIQKQALKPFQLLQVDVKDLNDISRYWPQMRSLHLPRYQFTARDVRTGGIWYAYGESRDSTNSAVFIYYLLRQLKHYGVDMSEVTIQTDNGVEFVGHILKRHRVSGFMGIIEDFGAKYRRIPPRACSWQSDVEVCHKLIEEEFYDIEDYRDRAEFMAKAYAYCLYFNYRRKNRWKGCKTPVELLRAINSEISPKVFNLRPIVLDDYIDELLNCGYHVPTSV
ncbi:MAG: helix-turn-helix domain-containing protein, partial [candidate division WOR-3 bacterium]|nr:helix-turn-helix domain-containing protein [candidate division WOR-3 bacterium]